MDSERSLITDALRAAVGSETPPRTFVIDRQIARRLAEALDEDADAVAAGEHAPAFYIAAFETQMVPAVLPEPLQGGVLAGDEWDLLRPIRWDERITGSGRVAEIYERFGGRNGQTLYMRFEWTFTDDGGAVVARASRIMARWNATAGEEAP
jgi:N-terminal half of MaoC dehydratase